MKVLSSLKPHAMMSLAFWYAKPWHCSSLRFDLNRNFSSSASERTAVHSVSLRPEQRVRAWAASMAAPARHERVRGRRTSELDDERAVEHVLEPLGEDEGDHVAEVHRVARRAAARVEVEGLLLLVPVEDEVELAARTPT